MGRSIGRGNMSRSAGYGVDTGSSIEMRNSWKGVLGGRVHGKEDREEEIMGKSIVGEVHGEEHRKGKYMEKSIL
jgi:hypothetical protein